MFYQASVAVIIAFAPVQAEQLVGTWVGALTEPDNTFQPVGMQVVRGADGTITARAEGPDQPDGGPPVKNLTLSDGVVTFEIEGIEGRANLRLVGDRMTGVWESPQGELPLTLTRQPAA